MQNPPPEHRCVGTGHLRGLLGYLLKTNHLVYRTSKQCVQIKSIGYTLADSGVDQSVIHSSGWQNSRVNSTSLNWQCRSNTTWRSMCLTRSRMGLQGVQTTKPIHELDVESNFASGSVGSVLVSLKAFSNRL